MCIRKKVFGPPPLIHNNYTGNVGLQIWVILTLIVPVTWTTFRIEFCVFPLLWPLRLIFSPAISIICPIFCVQGHFGKGRFNHCLVVFTDLIRTTVCVLRSLQEKVWTSGNQNGRPWNTFFFFLTHVDLYAYRKVKHWPGLFLRWHAVGPIGAQILSAVMSFTQIYWMCHN